MKYSLKTLTKCFFTRHTEQTHTHTGDLNRARIASQSLSARRSLFDARLSLVRSVDRHLVSRLLVVVVGRWFNVKDKNVIKAFARHCQSIYSQQRAANEDDWAHSFPDDKIFRPDWFHNCCRYRCSCGCACCRCRCLVVVSLEIWRGGKRWADVGSASCSSSSAS